MANNNNQDKLIAKIVRLKQLEADNHRAARRFIASNHSMPEAWKWPEQRVREFITSLRRQLEALRS